MNKLKRSNKLFESRLRVNLQDVNEISEKLTMCDKLGIENIILEPKKETFKIESKKKKEIRELNKINIFFRNTYFIKDLKELKQKIHHLKDSKDIISIESPNKEVQSYAARDSRIDLVSFSNYRLVKTFSEGVLSLAEQNNSFIEFCLDSIMIKKKSYQSKVFRSLYKVLSKGINQTFIISGNFKDTYDLRHPRSLISIVHTLFGVPISKAKRTFSTHVVSLLKRVELRNDPLKFEDGVKLIKKDTT